MDTRAKPAGQIATSGAKTPGNQPMSAVRLDNIRDALNYLRKPECGVLSFDVFDTLLLRNGQPELARFRRIAQRQTEAIRLKSGLDLTVDDVHYARVLAHRLTYATAPVYRENAEGTIQEICRLTAQALRLPETMIGLLHQEELAYERSALRPNMKLVPLMDEARELHKPIILISDMYLTASDIGHLLDAHFGPLDIRSIFVSSEYGHTKHQGGLYRLVRRRLNVGTGRVLHLGDNHHSDVVRASQYGLAACWLPRHPLWTRVHRARDRRARWRYGRAFALNL
jgi:predicted HAD superfamily hydrolase